VQLIGPPTVAFPIRTRRERDLRRPGRMFLDLRHDRLHEHLPLGDPIGAGPGTWGRTADEAGQRACPGGPGSACPGPGEMQPVLLRYPLVMVPPIWPNTQGQRLPPHPCQRAGSEPDPRSAHVQGV